MFHGSRLQRPLTGNIKKHGGCLIGAAILASLVFAVSFGVPRSKGLGVFLWKKPTSSARVNLFTCHVLCCCHHKRTSHHDRRERNL
ncbi:hypothetical protein JTE90_005963 [Oedothorax gibbosus]|uniref:Uncharacterized protein n=1 Tax=Oedothorax gibbosus TaxID=931172 RepID=A0AAV6UXR9_9ARAC|nr:hypothetical protein JTE90_005963 [Oedothorax gibbosus]